MWVVDSRRQYRDQVLAECPFDQLIERLRFHTQSSEQKRDASRSNRIGLAIPISHQELHLLQWMHRSSCAERHTAVIASTSGTSLAGSVLVAFMFALRQGGGHDCRPAHPPVVTLSLTRNSHPLPSSMLWLNGTPNRNLHFES
jgi:hypothetical protein